MRPMLFKTAMVQALLAGTKTQTRRLVKPQPDTSDDRPLEIWHGWPSLARSGEQYHNITPPYGRPGDVIWVRETWWSGYPYEGDEPQYERLEYWYKADTGDARPGDVSDEWCYNEFGLNKECWPRWKSSMFMPREACRLFLEITDIRVEQLQDISESDAVAEGVDYAEFSTKTEGVDMGLDEVRWRDYAHSGWPHAEKSQLMYGSAVGSYRSLWEQINGYESWDRNEWVWVVTFKRIEEPC